MAYFWDPILTYHGRICAPLRMECEMEKGGKYILVL